MKYLTVVFVLLPLLVSCCAADDISDKGFFFIQMADSQFGMWSGNKDVVKETETCRKAVEHINRLKPAFVIINGDLINDAHNVKQTRAFWRVFGQIRPDVPLYLVSGNHDVYTPTAESIRSYEKLFGKNHYSFSYNGSKFIVLNSQLITNPGAAPALYDEQLAWFKEQLSAAGKKNARHIFVCVHHPFYNKTRDEANAYENIPIPRREEYLSLMEKAGVDVILAGHRHHNIVLQDGKMQMITTAAVGMPIGTDPSGLRIVKVYKDRIEHNYYGLDEMPATVELK